MATKEPVLSSDMIVENDYTKPPISFEAIKRYYERHRDSMHSYITECYKNHYMYSADRKAQLEKDKETWRTNIKAPITHMYVSGVHNMLIDSDVRFTAIDKKGDKAAAMGAILDIAEYTTAKEDSAEAIDSAEFDAVVLGFGYYKTSYVYKKNVVLAVDKNGKQEKFEEKKDYAVVRYVSPYNIFGPAYKTACDKRMIFERKLIPSTKIIDEYSIYKQFKFNAKEVDEKGTYIDNMDREAIKENIPFYSNTDGRDIFDDQTYNIKDKMLEVFEAHTDNTLSIWINGIYHGTFVSLGPLKKIRYYEINFKKIPGTKKAIGVAYIVKPVQEVFDTILNMRIDNVKLTLNKTFFVDQSANIFGNDKTFKLKPGSIFQVRSVDGVKEMQISDVKQSAYTELDSMFQMTQGLIGVSAPGLGMQQKVERTAAGAEILKNAADNQLKPLLKSISRAMSEMFKDIVILSYYYMDDDTLVDVCGEEGAAALKEVKIEDIMRDISFSYDMTSQSSETIAIKRQQLQGMLDQAGRLTDFGGMPLFDMEVIATEYAKTYNLDFDANMTPDKITEVLKRANDIKNSVQAQGMQVPAAEGEETSGGEVGQTPIQQLPGAAVPTEMQPNPTGVTEAAPL